MTGARLVDGLEVFNAVDPACAGAPTVVFFPEKVGGGRGYSLESFYDEAKAICRRCPAETREACLEWALAHNEPAGCWGMKTPRERLHLRRERMGRS